jgi:uncharacterized protein (DUF2062 family)
LKLNKPIAIGTSYFCGIPPVIPLLIFISHEIGAFALQNGNHLVFAKRNELTVQFVWENIVQQYIGGLIFASIASLLISFIVYVLIQVHKSRIK